MIQPTSNYLGFNRADAQNDVAPKNAPAASSGAAPSDHLSDSNTQALRDALTNSPEIRPDVVARGNRLLVDGNYPPREIIESIAKLIIASRDLSEGS